jgi:hypothetical protein
VPVFDARDLNRADWPLLQNGAVNLFWRREYLEDAIESLRPLGYLIERIDCSDYERFRVDVSRAFRFEESFGYSDWTGNLDALDDAMWSVFDSGGDQLAVALTDFDVLYRTDRRTAECFADGFEISSRAHLLVGCRSIALIQTNDPTLELKDLGARSASWNHREWPRKNREL